MSSTLVMNQNTNSLDEALNSLASLGLPGGARASLVIAAEATGSSAGSL